MRLPRSLDRLVDELSKLPTVGRKTARRLAFNLVTEPRANPKALAEALLAASKNLKACQCCGGLSEADLCLICADPARNPQVILVVEEARNVFTIEESGIFKGQYHVLGGAVSPMRGIGPERLNLASLKVRIAEGEIEELIIATNPTLEGEATAHYLTDLFSDQVPKISRIARGMPTGGDLEYADPGTLMKAIEGRTNFS